MNMHVRAVIAIGRAVISVVRFSRRLHRHLSGAMVMRRVTRAVRGVIMCDVVMCGNVDIRTDGPDIGTCERTVKARRGEHHGSHRKAQNPMRHAGHGRNKAASGTRGQDEIGASTCRSDFTASAEGAARQPMDWKCQRGTFLALRRWLMRATGIAVPPLSRAIWMSVFPEWPANRLLLALPARVRTQVLSSVERIECERHQVLADADRPLDHVYFPDRGVISVVAVYPDGTVIEMATIGREGGTGFQAVFGAKTSSVRLLVQIPGSAAKMPRKAFQSFLEDIPTFRTLMFAHVHAFLEQVMISTGCNGAHNLTQRLARWILMMRDRHDDDTLLITQDLLAEMLGVQRPTITNAIHALRRSGLISCGRRRLTVLNREGLIEAACECYTLARARTAQHLPKSFPN